MMTQFRGYYPSSAASSSNNIPSSSFIGRGSFQSFSTLYNGENGPSSSTDMAYSAPQTTPHSWTPELDAWLKEPAELPPSNTPFAYFDPPSVHTASLPPPFHDYPTSSVLPSTSYLPVDVDAIEREILNIHAGPEPQPAPELLSTVNPPHSPLTSELDTLLREIEEFNQPDPYSLLTTHYEETEAFLMDKYAGQPLFTSDEYASGVQRLGRAEEQVEPAFNETYGWFAGHDASWYGHTTTFPLISEFETAPMPPSSLIRGSTSHLATMFSPQQPQLSDQAGSLLPSEISGYTSPPPPFHEAAGQSRKLSDLEVPTVAAVADIPAVASRKRKAPEDEGSKNAERDIKRSKVKHEELHATAELKTVKSGDDIDAGKVTMCDQDDPDFSDWDALMKSYGIQPTVAPSTDSSIPTNAKKRKATSEPDEKEHGSNEDENQSAYSPRKRQQIRQGKKKAYDDMPIEGTRSVAGRKDIQEPAASSVRREGTPSSLFSASDDNVPPFEPPSEALSCGKVQECQLLEQNLPVSLEGSALRDPVLSSGSRGKSKARRAVRPPRKISRTNTEKERYPCVVDGCEKSFTRTHDVKRHMSSVHHPVEYECVSCGAKLNGRKDSVQRHERTCRAAPGRDNHKKGPGSGRGPRMAGQKSTT